MKWETFFLVSKVFSLRLKKYNKNISEIILNSMLIDSLKSRRSRSESTKLGISKTDELLEILHMLIYCLM